MMKFERYIEAFQPHIERRYRAVQRHDELFTGTPALLTVLLGEYTSISIRVKAPPYTAGRHARSVYEMVFGKSPVAMGLWEIYAPALIGALTKLLPQLEPACVSSVPGLEMEAWKNGGGERLVLVRHATKVRREPSKTVECWVLGTAEEIDHQIDLIRKDFADAA